MTLPRGGSPLVIAFGQDLLDHETLSAFGPTEGQVWRAKVPYGLEYLTRVTPSDGAGALAALGREGGLLLFDLEGRLLFDGSLPDLGEYTYGLEAGRLPDGSWALIATSLNRSFLYGIDVSRLSEF
ncbi:MAG: hypothetical protein AAF368_01730 [Planctomycetota bacterium]